MPTPKQSTAKPLPSSVIKEMYAHPGFLLRRAHQISVAVFAQECGEFLTPPQFTALMTIHLVPGIDQIGVARIMGFDRTTSALVISNLVKRELITRAQDTQDRRRYHLLATAAGREAISKVTPSAARSEKRMMAVFSREEQRVFVALLQRFAESFNEQSPAPVDATALPMARYRLAKTRG